MTSASRVLALDIGGTKIAAGIVELDGAATRVTARCAVATPAEDGADAVVAAALDAARVALVTDPGGVGRCGVATAGVVDTNLGVVTHATDLIRGWAGTPLAALLSSELGLPVHCLNDVHAHGLGEATAGAGAAHTSMVLIAAGTGIGGAFVRDGRIDPGTRGAAWHIGHLPSPEAGAALCSCGRRGHLEPVASGSGILAEFRRRGGIGAAGTRDLDGLVGPQVALATEVIRTAGYALGRAIGGLLNTLDPEIVVLSGGLTGAGERWLGAVREGVTHDAMDVVCDTPLVLAATGVDAGLIGAARWAADMGGER